MTEAHWILENNFKHCLSIAASEVGLGFDDDDWAAVRCGLQMTSDVDSRWFSYTLIGSDRKLDFECALDDGGNGTGIVHVRFTNLTDSHVAARLATILGICAEYTFMNTAHYTDARDNKTDAGNGSHSISRVTNPANSPSPNPV